MTSLSIQPGYLLPTCSGTWLSEREIGKGEERNWYKDAAAASGAASAEDGF